VYEPEVVDDITGTLDDVNVKSMLEHYVFVTSDISNLPKYGSVSH